MINKSHRDVDRAFIYHVMFELGIVPMDVPEMDMGRPLKELDPTEARAFRRKFRKVWRKMAKKELEAAKKSKSSWQIEHVNKTYGCGKQTPSRSEKLARKRLVYARIWNEVVVPMLKEFEKPRRDKA